ENFFTLASCLAITTIFNANLLRWIYEQLENNAERYPLNKWGQTTYSGTILRHLRLVIERFTPDY
ncbi:hypothetical protein QHH03_29495, partial [Aphanizomenon sp. 202]|nr:hypothetical protein [Aphanizomenon sp. 202]